MGGEVDLSKYLTQALASPEWFFEDFLKFPLTAWQYDFVNAALDPTRKSKGLATRVNHGAKPRITVRSCHGTGKTQGLAALSHIWNFVNGGKIAATAPKQDQLLKRFLPRYRKILSGAPEVYQYLINVYGREIKIAGNPDWGLNCETAVDPDNLSGYHDTPQLFIVDEASSRRLDHLYPVIEGALTTPGSVCAEIGNPTRMEGEFFQHHNRKDLEPLYHRMHVRYQDAPRFISPEWVNSMRIKYGEDSPVFKIRVLGEFADFDSATLIPLEFIEEAFDADIEPDGSHPVLRVAVDVADGGADDTMITPCRRYDSFDHILQQKAFNFSPSVAVIKSAEAAITLFEAHGGQKDKDEFVVDANGVGAGTAGVLIDKGYRVIRHIGGEKADDPSRWRNRRVQNHMSMYDRFSQYRVKIDKSMIDDVEQFIQHMVAVKRDSSGDDKFDDIQTAEKVKAELGESPDRSASASMIFHGERPECEVAMAGDLIQLGSMFANESY